MTRTPQRREDTNTIAILLLLLLLLRGTTTVEHTCSQYCLEGSLAVVRLRLTTLFRDSKTTPRRRRDGNPLIYGAADEPVVVAGATGALTRSVPSSSAQTRWSSALAAATQGRGRSRRVRRTAVRPARSTRRARWYAVPSRRDTTTAPRPPPSATIAGSGSSGPSPSGSAPGHSVGRRHASVAVGLTASSTLLNGLAAAGSVSGFCASLVAGAPHAGLGGHR
mmetsp:Transcript_15758/g.63470  ORF Transcript_15758/g.63470 Transcript_15758/m.63470 type:complete len:222 (+) Transcript_15758:80-745(+)